MKLRFSGTLLLFCILSVAAQAQGIIVPSECRRCPPIQPTFPPRELPRVLNVKSIKITTRVESQVATTKVEQVFENTTPYRLEGSYFFPIPESASLSDFAIYDGEKRMVGEVVERNKARQIYNEIVRKMIDPGLLEYVGKDLFQANVFPIEPRSTRKIDLTYTQVLKNEGGTVSYRYALGSGRRILNQPASEVSASVEISSPVDLKNIYSPSHKISLKRDGERRARLSFEGSGQEAQKDFLLYYSLSEKEFGLSLLSYKEPGKDGYFLMLLSPKVEITDQDRMAKDVVFVFDTSGSMSGEKLEKAKAALRFGVESLSPRDRYNIISFSGEEHLMKEGLTEATRESRQESAAFIDRLRAEGGTNINDALVSALKQFRSPERSGMIVFLTDGLPTVGIADAAKITANVAEANRAGVRIFSFGVGYDVNTSLLDKISADNRGASDYIEPKEDIEVKVSNFFTRVNYPVLSELKLEFGGVHVELVYPKSMPDLFKGSQLALVGRYKNPLDSVDLKLSGKLGTRSETLTFPGHSFSSKATGNEFLPRLWATRRVGYLMEQIRLNRESREVIDEIVSLGTRFGIVTPYTSFLVTEEMKEMARRGGASGNAAYEFLGGMTARNPQAAPSGEAAVRRSRAESRLKDAEASSDIDGYLTTVRTVEEKTFLLKEGAWLDSSITDDLRLPKVQVKFGSEEFFDLISKEPELSKFFALGQKVSVVFNGKLYQVE